MASINSDSVIQLKISQVVPVAVFLVTFGASIYTLFHTLPQIDQLDKQVQSIQQEGSAIRSDIAWLKQLLKND